MTTTSPAVRHALTVPAVGVEEEFFVLRRDGSAASVTGQMLADLPPSAHIRSGEVPFQVESVTAATTTLVSLAAELSVRRRNVANSAAQHAALMVSVGTPPFAIPRSNAVPDDDRSRRSQNGFPQGHPIVGCGMHVNVTVPSRDLGVEALNRVRGWLPALLALSGNSPLWEGHDSGWESYRHERSALWPTARIPPSCTDAVAYDAAVSEEIRAGRAPDPAGVYWFARLSPELPTLEIRVADAGLTVRDSLLMAALSRALVATALAEARSGREQRPVPDAVLTQSLHNAARHGLRALLVDPETGVLAPGYTVFYQLVDHVDAALQAAGDRLITGGLITERRARQSGASRQRTMLQRLDRPHFVAALAAASLGGVPGAETSFAGTGAGP